LQVAAKGVNRFCRAGDGLLRRQGLVGGELGGDGVERAHPVVEVLPPAQIMIGDGDRREFARADGRGQLDHG
jgi:hypothetical protein